MTALVTGNVKFIAGQYKVPGSLDYDDDTGLITVGFRYNKILIEEIKAFDGSRWNPEKKKWTIKDNCRNRFQLEYLLGKNPYAPFDAELIEHVTNRPLYDHQLEMVRHALTRHYCVLAAEMGTGKSLAVIEVMEASGFKDWWWIAPKSALRSVQLECEKWGSRVRPRFLTYEGMVKEIKHWQHGRKAPRGVVFDESSRIKMPTSQRSQAAMELAEGVRNDWGGEGFVILMSGTPAPRSPGDWWHQAEVACPGFLREGTKDKFERRLGIVEMKESIQGGVYPKLITWKDDENKCGVCGKYREDSVHDAISMVTEGNFHTFEPSINEIKRLYERLNGLVLVKFKKDCLDLPEKQYEVIEVKPSPTILRAASLIEAKATTTIQMLTMLRELSDGFQYAEEEVGEAQCPLCRGRKEIEAPSIDHAIMVTEENIEALTERYPDQELTAGEQFMPPEAVANYDEKVEVAMTTCPRCQGDGTIRRYQRIVESVGSPKDDVVVDLLDRYDDVGRCVFYGGFSGSIDRIVDICHAQKWETIKVDGRGWQASWGFETELNMLRIFQDAKNEDHPRVVFVGQPSAAGMGLTLTASPMICFYSNDFNGESRWQAEDRIHRAGMDVNRGCTIYDIVHLPTDRMVLDNLQKKRNLMDMSMGQLRSTVQEALKGAERKL